MSNAFNRHKQNTSTCRPSAAECERPQMFVFPERAEKSTPETPVLSPPPPSPVWPLTPDLRPTQPAILSREPTAIAAANTTQLDTTSVREQGRGPKPQLRIHIRKRPPPLRIEIPPEDPLDYCNISPTTGTCHLGPNQAYENCTLTRSPQPGTGRKRAIPRRGLTVTNDLYDALESGQYPPARGISPEQPETYDEATQLSNPWGDTFDDTAGGILDTQSPHDDKYAPEWRSLKAEPKRMQPLPSFSTRKRNAPAPLHLPSASRSPQLSPVRSSLEPGAEAGQPLPYDIYVASQNVLGLTEGNFQTYINNKDLAMVMFYDPFDPNNLVPKEHFKKAAETRKHGSQEFAAVNCQREPDFCAKLGANILPMFKFYSRGKVLGTIRETTQFDYTFMTQYMDTLGSMGESVNTSRNPLQHLLPEIKHARCVLAKKLGFKK